MLLQRLSIWRRVWKLDYIGGASYDTKICHASTHQLLASTPRRTPKTRLGLYKHLTNSAHFSILVYTMDANSTMEVNLKVGDKFSDYAALLKQIDMYENHKLVNLYKRSSRSIENVKKRMTRLANVDNSQLQFGEIDYSCVHRSKNFKSSSMRSRMISNTTSLYGNTYE